MPVVKTSSKGQVVIPKEVRDKLGIKAGNKIIVKVVDDHAEIIPLPDNPIEALCGCLKGGPSLAEELLKERRRDNEIDEPE
jgi:AbrB family looped-hinge helix DNA binding protein